MLELTLVDDGTADMALEAECSRCFDVTLHRFYRESIERDPDGSIPSPLLRELAEELEAGHSPFCGQ